MPTWYNRPEFDQTRFEKSQIGGDYYREIAERELIPRIAERNKQVLNVVPDVFSFFQRGYVGRRCSCWSGNETSPSSQCILCFRTGNTAGYQKYGHWTEVFDVTAVAASVNVMVDYTEITRPLSYRLVNGALTGYVDFVVPAVGGESECSLVELHAVANRGTRVLAGIKLFSEDTFTPLSMAAVTARLAQAQLEGGMVLRVSLKRVSVSTKSPKYAFTRIRVKTRESDEVRADVGKSPQGNKSSDIGWFTGIGTRTLFLNNQLRFITPDDVFFHRASNSLWKIVEITPIAPAGILLSWEVVVEFVQQSEVLASLR